jgi:hypothetical protein
MHHGSSGAPCGPRAATAPTRPGRRQVARRPAARYVPRRVRFLPANGAPAAAGLMLLLLQAPVHAAVFHPLDTTREDPVGEDPTRPRPELALKYGYLNAPGPSPDSVSLFTLEGILRVPLSEHWTGRLRFEMPLGLTNVPRADDPDGAWRFGAGDLLTEAEVIHYANARWAIGAGGRALFPTTSLDVVGDDAWVLGVVGVVRAMLPELGPDSFVAPQLAYGSDVGGRRRGEQVSALLIQPTLHWAATHAVFLELFPSDDIIVNFQDPARRGRLFLPITLLAGVLLTPRVATTLELGFPLIKDYPVYDFKLQAAVAIFFD